MYRQPCRLETWRWIPIRFSDICPTGLRVLDKYLKLWENNLHYFSLHSPTWEWLYYLHRRTTFLKKKAGIIISIPEFKHNRYFRDLPSLDGKHCSQQNNYKHKKTSNDSCHFHSVVNLFFWFHGIGILRRSSLRGCRMEGNKNNNKKVSCWNIPVFFCIRKCNRFTTKLQTNNSVGGQGRKEDINLLSTR